MLNLSPSAFKLRRFSPVGLYFPLLQTQHVHAHSDRAQHTSEMSRDDRDKSSIVVHRYLARQKKTHSCRHTVVPQRSATGATMFSARSPTTSHRASICACCMRVLLVPNPQNTRARDTCSSVVRNSCCSDTFGLRLFVYADLCPQVRDDEMICAKASVG